MDGWIDGWMYRWMNGWDGMGWDGDGMGMGWDGIVCMCESMYVCRYVGMYEFPNNKQEILELKVFNIFLVYLYMNYFYCRSFRIYAVFT